jgi:pimeloyl-ACP methyl ester carboxylesterase
VVIGASLGGFMAALETAGEESVKAIVLLSPGTAEPFVEAVGRRHDRPTLLVAGSDDPGARAGAEAMLARLDRSRSALAVYDDAGHGTEMLERVPELTPFVVRWVKGALKGARGL